MEDYIHLLQQLISVPSFSREEEKTAAILAGFLTDKGVPAERLKNNVWAVNKFFDREKPTVLLNSHHDTVRPNPGYTRDPFDASIEDGKLFGLGSNDAGGALVSLLATFLHFYDRTDLKFNIVYAATAEEEISGAEGIELVWPLLPQVSFAIVGEPTLNQVAIAEKGLLVVDAVARGKAGHAAREEGVNALYIAMDDIQWLRTFHFPKRSDTLGNVKMTATVIQAGKQHNVVPAECSFVIDVRVTDAYTLEEVFAVMKANLKSELTARSFRLKSSGIALDHPLVLQAKRMGLTLYGSPTTSDQALIPVTSIKMGPGDSARSHSANEFIYLTEILDGVACYIKLLEGIEFKPNT